MEWRKVFDAVVGWTGIDLEGQMGIAWEFRGKNLELLGLIMKELQFYLGTSWE